MSQYLDNEVLSKVKNVRVNKLNKETNKDVELKEIIDKKEKTLDVKKENRIEIKQSAEMIMLNDYLNYTREWHS